MNENVLDQLAELCGIEPEYHDIWGRTHKVSEKTKLDLLRVMGLPRKLFSGGVCWTLSWL